MGEEVKTLGFYKLFLSLVKGCLLNHSFKNPINDF